MPRILIGRIMPGPQSAGFHVPEQIGAGEPQQGSHEASLERFHARETGRPAPTQRAQQDRLGLIVGVVSGEDPACVVNLPHPAEPPISRLTRLGFTGIRPQRESRDKEWKPGSGGEFAYPCGDVSAFEGDSVVGVGDEEVELVRLATLEQQVEESHRVRSTRHRDNGATGREAERGEVGCEAVLHGTKIIADC